MNFMGNRHVIGWLLISPAAILLVTFTHYPAVTTFFSSLFSRGNPIRPSKFVGADQYLALLDDPVFWTVLENNLYYAIGTIPASIALAIAMALLVDRALAGTGFLRLAYFTPTILPMIAVANIWLFFYTPEIGLLDRLLNPIGIETPNWLGDPSTALLSLIFITIWKEAGFFMIFYLAALQAQSPELKEAAKLEGASAFTFFRRVTFPLLMPTTLFVLVNAVLNSFKLVDHIFILTKGGPDNASSLILYYIYETAFSFFDTPYASALTIILLLFLGILALIQFGVLERRIHYR